MYMKKTTKGMARNYRQGYEIKPKMTWNKLRKSKLKDWEAEHSKEPKTCERIKNPTR